jgi:uncharacterized membrane protein YphA (DoxX/SURF4 family)
MKLLRVKKEWRKTSITLVPLLFLGLILLISGTGKLPGQAEFADVLLQSFWGPTMGFLIASLLPWAEVVLGVALLLWIFPRIAAILTLPLVLGFIANNSWALSQGMDKFPKCGYCFGIFEEFFGAVSPLQSLIIDIALLIAALLIILFHPGGFLSFRPWFLRWKRKVAYDKTSS